MEMGHWALPTYLPGVIPAFKCLDTFNSQNIPMKKVLLEASFYRGAK